MTENLSFAEMKKVTLTTANLPYKICVLRGGESVTIKYGGVLTTYVNLCFDDGNHPDKVYRLDPGESVTLALSSDYGRRNRLIIWGTDSSGAQVVWTIKIPGVTPVTRAAAT